VGKVPGLIKAGGMDNKGVGGRAALEFVDQIKGTVQ